MAYNQIPIDSGMGFSKHSELVVGRVRNVVLSPYVDDQKTLNPEYDSPSDIGKIRYDIVYQNRQVLRGDASSRPAWPIFSFIKQYPVIGELVLLVMGPTTELNDYRSAQQAYYFPPYNLWNSPNHNAFPELTEYADFVERYYQKPGYQYDQTGSVPELPKGAYFSEKSIQNLEPFEGDTIIQGRFGQSIRFGSTNTLKKKRNSWSNFGKDGDPITIIRNGQGRDTRIKEEDINTARASILPDQPVIENINDDDSSIYLTSGQSIEIKDFHMFPMKSYGIDFKTQSERRVTKVEQNPTLNESRSARQNDAQ